MTTNENGHESEQGEVVNDIIRTVKERLVELQPYLDEAAKLRAVLEATEGRKATPRPAGARRQQGENKRAIFAVIARQPGVTAADIARTTGMKRTVVASTVSRLKRTGELEPEGRGVRLPANAGGNETT
jgi:hypothetical protein